LHRDIDLGEKLVVATALKNVLNARERINLLHNTFVELPHILDHSDCAIFLWTDNAG
jgi:hypothetical protein